MILGFNIQILTISCVNGEILVLKDGIRHRVPNKLRNFQSVFEVMESVIRMKVCGFNSYLLLAPGLPPRVLFNVLWLPSNGIVPEKPSVIKKITCSRIIVG